MRAQSSSQAALSLPVLPVRQASSLLATRQSHLTLPSSLTTMGALARHRCWPRCPLAATRMYSCHRARCRLRSVLRDQLGTTRLRCILSSPPLHSCSHDTSARTGSFRRGSAPCCLLTGDWTCLVLVCKQRGLFDVCSGGPEMTTDPPALTANGPTAGASLVLAAPMPRSPSF